MRFSHSRVGCIALSPSAPVERRKMGAKQFLKGCVNEPGCEASSRVVCWSRRQVRNCFLCEARPARPRPPRPFRLENQKWSYSPKLRVDPLLVAQPARQSKIRSTKLRLSVKHKIRELTKESRMERTMPCTGERAKAGRNSSFRIRSFTQQLNTYRLDGLSHDDKEHRH